MSLRKNTRDERSLIEAEVAAATTINKDALFNNIVHGVPIPQSKASGGGSSSEPNESSSLYAGVFDPNKSDYLFETVASTMGADGIRNALHNDPALIERHSAAELLTKTASSEQSKDIPHISQRQWTAIQKYPALIEFLGSDFGDKIATEVAAKANVLMIDALNKNAKQLSKHAYTCESAGKNIKQYFVNKECNWICQVIANGPFRGDEAIYYDPDADKSSILRRRGDNYDDVSGDFNIIHEFASSPAGDESSGAKQEEKEESNAVAE